MYICWRSLVFNFGEDCIIWSAALCVIRRRVSETSTVEQFDECEKWVSEQSDAHWCTHLRGWLKYVRRHKDEECKNNIKSLKVEAALKQFYNK